MKVQGTFRQGGDMRACFFDSSVGVYSDYTRYPTPCMVVLGKGSGSTKGF